MLENVPAHIHNPNPSIYASNNYLVVDFETTNKSVGEARDKTGGEGGGGVGGGR